MEEKFLQEVAKYKKKGPKHKRLSKIKHKHKSIPYKISFLSYGFKSIGNISLWIDEKCTICGKITIVYKTLCQLQIINLQKEIDENIKFFQDLEKKC